jgi:serine/threonine protein kinase
MTIKLTPASFLSGVRQSGLIEPQKLEHLIAEIEQSGTDRNSAQALAGALVRLGAITEWQSDKLLQGRHKGFILGRYKLLSLLGAGEMSAVYLAEHVMLERRCAIKVLPGNKVKDTSYLGRFHREAKAVARLNHINIVRAYDVDQQSDSGTEIHFLVMEYVAGRNIEKVVSEKGPLDFISAAEYIRQAADGLGHAHQAGMVHRDIKPENLLIDTDGCVKILDLGLARFFQQSEEESLTIKHDEKVLGTADYLAPEQAIDSHKVDARADIYSLGCTFYFALTGNPPFTEGTLVQRLFAHQTKTPKAVTEFRRDVPAELVAILDKMMAKKAADRYQTARDLAQTLTHWLVENAGRDWQVKHIQLVAEVKGMDGFFNQPDATKTHEKQVQTALVNSGVPKSTVTAVGAVRNRDGASPTVQFYSTLATPSGTQASAQSSASGVPASTSAELTRSPRVEVVTSDDSPNNDQNPPRRDKSDLEARRRRAKARAAQDRESNSDERVSSATATAVASPPRRSGTTSTRTAVKARSESKVQTNKASESGVLTWLSSNNKAHVQTRRMVTWVALAAVTLVCFSGFVFWIIQSMNIPNKQVTQPQQDNVIDALPRSSRV